MFEKSSHFKFKKIKKKKSEEKHNFLKKSCFSTLPLLDLFGFGHKLCLFHYAKLPSWKRVKWGWLAVPSCMFFHTDGIVWGRVCYQHGYFGTNSGKARGVVWIDLPFGGPEGNQTFPRGAAPRETLLTQGTSRGQICQTILKAFPLFVRRQASNIKENVSPMM